MSRTRILYLILGLSIGEPLGGAERLVIELVSRLDRARFEPIVCAFWRHHTHIERYWAEYLEHQGIEVFFASDWRGKHGFGAYDKGIETIIDHLGGRQIDLVHCHFQMGNMVALALRRRLGVVGILRTAQAGKEWGDGMMAFACRQVLTKWVFPLAFDGQTAVSQTGVAKINRYPGTRLAGRQAILIPNGVSYERFHDRGIVAPAVREELGLTTGDLVIGSVGRLSPEKGHSILLQAAPIVIQRFPTAKFIIVGDGELRNSLHQQSRDLGLDGAVVWAGARTDVESVYRLMDVFVLPSFWEGLPIVILESMASGIPVVASDLPGVRELIEPNVTGWLAEPGSPRELASCIVDALGDPEARSRIARTAMERVVPSFSLDSIVEQYGQVYDHLTSGTPGDPTLQEEQHA